MKQLKAFIPFTLTDDSFFKWLGTAAKPANVEDFHDKAEAAGFVTRDPEGSQWGTLGMASFDGTLALSHDLDGAARLLLYQFNDRILPGTVRDEKTAERVAELQQQGEKIHKKMYAKIRDDVEAALLPNAFIRRSLVPVLVFKNKLLICTSSPKKCDDIMVRLFKLADLKKGLKFNPEGVRTEHSPGFAMRELAEGVPFDDLDLGEFIPGTTIKLRGEDKRVISIKDREVLSSDVQELLKDTNYSVAELGCWMIDDAEQEVATFTLTERGFYKAIKLTDAYATRADKDDAHVTAWLLAKTFEQILDTGIAVMGGLVDAEKPAEDDEI